MNVNRHQRPMDSGFMWMWAYVVAGLHFALCMVYLYVTAVKR